MLPTEHRLKSERDFATIAKSRKSAFAKLLGVKMRENHLPHSRFGVSVGLKVHKRAVKRNLVKRRIREIIRKTLPNIKPGYDVLVMAFASSVNAEFPAIQADVMSCLKKLGILVPPKP